MTSELIPKLVLVSPREHERISPDAAESEVEVWRGNDGFQAYGYAARGYFWAQFPGTATFRFLDDDSDVAAIPEAGVGRGVVADVYYRNVLPLVLQLRGHEVLHASAVATRRGLVVLCGVSGAGKSTLAYRLSERGYVLWADDAVALELDADAIVAFQVPFRLGLRTDAAAFFQFEVGGLDAGEFVPRRSPIHALVILASSEAPDAPRTCVARLKPADAFAALLPHAYYFTVSDPTRKTQMVHRYLALASSVPVFEFCYRRGLGEISSVLDEMEERVVTT